MALAIAGCGSPEAAPAGDPTIPLPTGAQAGDEIVATVEVQSASGSFTDEASPGLLLELTLGANIARHVIIPGGHAPRLRVSLGAWDGGPLRLRKLAGEGDFTATTEVDPSASGVPIMGLFSDRYWNDVPFGVYLEDGLFTYIISNEDGGTGLFPTLLMARYGRPTDIEGLYQSGPEPTIQAPGHSWEPFAGTFEGTHPHLQLVTLNGLVGPDEDAIYRVSPMPLDFTTQGGAIPRERAHDQEPWTLAASFEEMARQGKLAEDGGPLDSHIGAPDDYIFIDYQFESDMAVIAFEAEVSGAWYSSLGLFTGLGGEADAHLRGVGRTCIELPPFGSAADVTALRAVAAGTGMGTLMAARWFRYDEALVPIEMGALASPAALGEGAAGEVMLEGKAP
jgi:hypothetical protein